MKKFLSVRWILATIFVLAGSALCVRLGIWQLDRLAQRKAFNAHYLAVSQMPVAELDSLSADDSLQMEYRKVSVRGTFDPEHSVVLRNQYNGNQPGYSLVTPLILSGGKAVLVQRGWIPAEGNKEPQDWRKYDISGEVVIHGIIRSGLAVPETGQVQDDPNLPVGTRFWNLLNVTRLSEGLPYPLLPVFIQPDSVPDHIEPPIPSQPVIEISEGPHQSYALQWFSFAVILFLGYPFYLRRQLRSQDAES